MSIPRKIAYNIAVSSVAKILSTLAALFGIGLITRYLGPKEFGDYSTALAFLSFFGAIGDWGLYQALTREISQPKANEQKIINNAAAIRFVVAIGVIFLSPFIVWFFPYSRDLKIAIILVSVAYSLSSSYQLYNGLFQKRLQMDRVVLAELVGKIIQVGLIVLVVKNHWGLHFIIATLIISMGINYLIVTSLTRRFIKVSFEFDLVYWKKFLRQSLPIGVSVLITFIYFKADTILLSLMKPAEDVGIYGAAVKVIESLSFFPAMVVGLTMPLLSFHIVSDREKFKALVNKNFKVFMILVIPLLIGTWFLSDGIIALVAGAEFAASAVSLRIIIFSLGFIFFGNLINNILIAARMQKYLLYSLTCCAVFNICSNLIFVPKYSYLATSFSSVFTEMLVVILGMILIYKKVHILPRINKLPEMFLAGAVMAGYLWIFKDSSFVLRLFGSPFVYFTLILLFNVVSRSELLSLIRKDAVVQTNQS